MAIDITAPQATQNLQKDANGHLRGEIFVHHRGAVAAYMHLWAAHPDVLKALANALMQYVTQLPPEIVTVRRLPE